MSMETKELVVYSCGYCGKLFREKKDADICHTDKTCSSCGKVIGKKDYYTDCGECRTKKAIQKEKDLFDKAEKMSFKEYSEKFPGYPTVNNGDTYFWDFEEIENHYDCDDCEMPEYVWGTRKEIKALDYGEIVERFEEQCGLEDFQMDKSAVEELKQFCEQWNKEHAKEVYWDDGKIAVLLK